MAPGDPFSDLAQNPNVPPELRLQLRQQLGLDDPVLIQYGRWAASMARGVRDTPKPEFARPEASSQYVEPKHLTVSKGAIVAGPRPGGVTLVAVLAWISGALQILTGVLILFGGQGGGAAVAWVAIIIGIITIIVSLGLFRGNNAARIIVAIIFALNLISAIITMFAYPSQLWSALIAGALAYWISWRAAFIIPGAVSVAIGIAFALTVPEMRIEGKRPAGAARTGFSRELLVRVFAVLAVTTLFGGVIFNSTTIAMPKIFDERLNALVSTTLGIGILVSLVYAFAAMAQLVVGHILDRGALKSVLVAVIGFQLPLLLAAAFFNNYVLLAVALAMMFFVFGQIPINDAIVGRYCADEYRSRVYAVRYVITFCVAATAVPLIALLHASPGGFSSVFVALAALALCMLAASFFFPSRNSLARQAVAA